MCVSKCLVLALAVSVAPAQVRPDAKARPNFVLIYADDLGYGDLGCYGSTKNRTPRIDAMAREGVRLTDFYSTSGVCTPSRSSLMTGCYPRRVNMHKDHRNGWVLFPNSPKGLNPDEITVAEILKRKSYRTACVGKWHLGDQLEFLPTRQGFEEYFGIPYSNDMGRKKIPLPLMQGEKVIEAPVKQPTLTKRYTEAAVKFLEANRDRSFFLYLPHTMPHLPLHASKDFKGKSSNGRYGDAIEEIDWSMGVILDTLKRLGIDDKTMVVFASDNGSNCRNGGSNAPLRGRKGSTDEGGMRVPCVVRWPGKIPPGQTCAELASTIDIMPTFAKLAGGEAPKDRTIDGSDIWPLLAGVEGARTPHDSFFYYRIADLQAVRAGKWKLILPRKPRKKQLPLRLIDLEADIHENTDVAEQHPKVVAKLMALAKAARADLGDGKNAGQDQRPAGRVKKAAPRLLSK